MELRSVYTSLGLGLVLLLITLKKFIFTHTQPKVNRDFENNVWRHLLDINDRIVNVRFSVTRSSTKDGFQRKFRI